MKLTDMLSEKERCAAEETLAKILKKMPAVAEKNRGRLPYTTGKEGRYDDRSDEKRFPDWGLGRSWWTNGFWGGILWQLFHATKDETYAELAREYETLLDPCFDQFFGLHHDVGFMWQPTAAADYTLTGNERAKARALHAATLLAGRFNPSGRFIRAWNEVGNDDTRGWAIIDCMMNLSLLYWASNTTGDPRFRQTAQAHADTAMASFIREDGSSCHIVEFDPSGAGMLRSIGGQGYAEGSAWTRGQAWAIYGFAISFLHTEKEAYLETSRKVADFFLSRMPESGVIPIDFDQPEAPALEDSCGAVIAASGMLELSRILLKRGEEDAANEYLRGAFSILEAVTERRACFDDSCDAIVQYCSGAYHANDHHITMVYADYFYIEAILKLTGRDFFLW